MSHRIFVKKVFTPTILIVSIVAGSAQAEPPLDTSMSAYGDDTWITSLSFKSMSVALEGLEVGNTDLEIKCVEFSAQQKQENTVYGAVSACFDGDLSGPEGEGNGFAGKIGYAIGDERLFLFIDVGGFRISFSDNPTDYEIQGAELNTGLMFAPFKHDKSNSIISNLLIGAQYLFTDYTESISNELDVERTNDVDLRNDAAILVQWRYIFDNGFGVSFNSSFLARDSLELRIQKSF